MTTFFEMLSVPDFQRATAQTRITQEAQDLAVAPKPALAPLIESGLRREVAGQDLATSRRRSDLLENKLDFQRKQAPFAIGLGALNLGVNVLGGVRAGQAQKQRAAQMGELRSIRQEGLRVQRENTRRLQDIINRQVGQLNQSFLPLNPPPAGAGAST